VHTDMGQWTEIRRKVSTKPGAVQVAVTGPTELASRPSPAPLTGSPCLARPVTSAFRRLPVARVDRHHEHRQRLEGVE
jgi:hypothetical protein